MNSNFLDLELRLLLLEFGRDRILQVLAHLGEQSESELRDDLAAIKMSKGQRRLKQSVVDLAAIESVNRPEIATELRSLAMAYQNGTFLPTLREVNRFVDRFGTNVKKQRSRATAAIYVIKILATFSQKDLVQLASGGDFSPNNDYSILARAIMGKPAAQKAPIKAMNANQVNDHFKKPST